MTQEEAVKFIHDSRVTSLGEFTHGFMVYESTAGIAIDKVADMFEVKIQELELIIKGKDVIIESMAQQRRCEGCINEFKDRSSCGDCEVCNRRYIWDNYQLRDLDVK